MKTLKQIENEEVDQHEASYAVGVLLKEMYIDSAMRKAEHLDQKNGVPEIKKPTVNISWSTYKKMQN